ILLSQAGLSFTAVEQGGLVPPQTFSILNLGTGPLRPAVSASTLSGGQWLFPALTASASGVPSVVVKVDPAGLTPGVYYGLVSVDSPGAANTPQVVTAMLQVLPAGYHLGASLLPNELTFNTVAGAESP